MYHQDWLMRQIEIIAETLARVLFRKTPARRADAVSYTHLTLPTKA